MAADVAAAVTAAVVGAAALAAAVAIRIAAAVYGNVYLAAAAQGDGSCGMRQAAADAAAAAAGQAAAADVDSHEQGPHHAADCAADARSDAEVAASVQQLAVSYGVPELAHTDTAASGAPQCLGHCQHQPVTQEAAVQLAPYCVCWSTGAIAGDSWTEGSQRVDLGTSFELGWWLSHSWGAGAGLATLQLWDWLYCWACCCCCCCCCPCWPAKYARRFSYHIRAGLGKGKNARPDIDLTTCKACMTHVVACYN